MEGLKRGEDTDEYGQRGVGGAMVPDVLARAVGGDGAARATWRKTCRTCSNGVLRPPVQCHSAPGKCTIEATKGKR